MRSRKNKVEVEGGEVAQAPGQNAVKFDGPSHGQGGIETLLPNGTDVYSKRIKVDGKTMAKRKEDRDKIEQRILDKLNSNKTDAPLKNTRDRVKQVNGAKDQMDKDIQTQVSQEIEMDALLAQMAEMGPEEIEGMLGDMGAMQPEQEMQEESMMPEMGQPKEIAAYGRDGGGLPQPMNSDPFAFLSYPDMNPGEVDSLPVMSPSQGGIGLGDLFGMTDSLPVMGSGRLETGATPNSLVPTNTPEGGATRRGVSGSEGGIGGDALSSLLGNSSLPTIGDATKIFGNLKQGADQRRLARENRSQDGNINHFQDFGKDSLATIDSSKDYVTANRDRAEQHNQAERNSLVTRGRNSARGVNAMRALDTNAQTSANNQSSQIQSNFANQMMQLLGQQSQMESSRDQVVMGGEDNKAERDTMDRDNFFSALSEASIAENEGISQTGKDINEIKTRGVNEELLNSMSDYFDFNAKTGKMTLRDPEGLKVEIGDRRIMNTIERTKPYLDWGYTEKSWKALSREKQLEKYKEKKLMYNG